MSLTIRNALKQNRLLLLLYGFYPERVATKNPKIARETWFKLMYEQDRKISHVLIYDPSTGYAYDFGNRGPMVRESIKTLAECAYVIPDNLAATVRERRQLKVKAKWAKDNHVQLLTKGRDKSDQLDENGVPKYFVCATYISWLLGLPDSHTYSSDKLFEYAIKHKWQRFEQDDFAHLPIFSRKLSKESIDDQPEITHFDSGLGFLDKD